MEVATFQVSLYTKEKEEYISLTDMARYRDADRTNYIIQNWMRTRSAIEFCGLWEQLYNSDFKGIGFDAFKNEAGANSFALTPQKWIESTNAIGIISKSGRYGGTFAHKDIAFEFATWLSPSFKFFLIKEFQRLKEEESANKNLEWNLQRTLAKINYRIHTDAIKDELLPPTLTREQRNMIYASEADVLNMALFGQTAADWRTINKNKKDLSAVASAKAENIRDKATLEQLVVLTNLESLNAVLIRQGLPQPDRLQKLNGIAISQMRSLLNNAAMKKLK